MSATAKSTQLQVRVSPAEKAAIQRAARRAGLDMSAYVLGRVLPPPARRFQDLTDTCRDPERARFALGELSSWLATLSASELQEAVLSPPAGLTPHLANYIAAMVEYACGRRGVVPPAWTLAIAPLTEPVFGSTLVSLRLYLLTHSPPPFRRRNIFIDATVGSSV
jgi:hypothetical protein